MRAEVVHLGAEPALPALSDAEGYIDAPAVLGWQAWRDLAGRYGLGLVQLALQSAIDAGAIAPQPVEPLAHVLIGALDECALYIAQAEDPAAARQQCPAIFDQILRGITPDT